ncbi:hypothetical protein GCM10025857_08790 [Alicyclobacillus contaminans]|nr:hypothetical protein GCM10025857_08790 [Alicyclobacillus contaminans]
MPCTRMMEETNVTRAFRETDMYPPLEAFFAKLGYTVQAEVKHCDIVAYRADELIVVEMKRTLNLEVVAQAVDRQKFTPSVYIAVPRPKANPARGEWRRLRTVLRRLELGLLFVALDSHLPASDRVQVVETLARTADATAPGLRKHSCGKLRRVTAMRTWVAARGAPCSRRTGSKRCGLPPAWRATVPCRRRRFGSSGAVRRKPSPSSPTMCTVGLSASPAAYIN